MQKQIKIFKDNKKLQVYLNIQEIFKKYTKNI